MSEDAQSSALHCLAILCRSMNSNTAAFAARMCFDDSIKNTIAMICSAVMGGAMDRVADVE